MTKHAAAAALNNLLIEARIVPELTNLLGADRRCFLVGGALRNAMLGHPIDDFDFALPDDPTDLGRRFAERIGGHFFVLDAARRQSRVVAGKKHNRVCYDFAPWRADTLEADLALRDYTINAMALPLEEPCGQVRPGDILDPLGGCDDLANATLRCCSATVLLDDPLRVLKGVRHCLVLGFQPDGNTLARLREAAPNLPEAAPERVRAEMGRIFAVGDGHRFGLLDRLGLPAVLFGPGSFEAGVECLERIQDWLDHLLRQDRRLTGFFDEVVEEFWPRRALLRFAAFLHGYRSAKGADSALERMSLGRKATLLLKGYCRLTEERFREIDRLPSAARGQALWVASLGPGRGEALVLAAVIAEADPRKRAPRLAELLKAYFALADEQGRIPDLVGGDWVRETLGIADGPRIGALLAALRLAEIEGRVSDIAEARSFLRRRAAK